MFYYHNGFDLASRAGPASRIFAQQAADPQSGSAENRSPMMRKGVKP
jgi:hypothetical protein